jgi:site-specific DNA-methyltransferase (adenine-specific)
MSYHVREGEALTLIPDLSPASIDAVITDPPYSSGGRTAGERAASPSSKYMQSGQKKQWAEFEGDNRDQRSWAHWCTLWLSACRRVTKPGGYCLVFTDWRQLPSLTDALQAGGWTWRGVIAWDKTGTARAPHTAYFRHQCEFVAWGTNGPFVRGWQDGPWPGCYRVPVDRREKQHMTGKPVALMRELVRCCPRGGTVLDPFAGSGSTGLAALLEGRSFVGYELTPHYAEIARQRLAQASQ